MMWLKTGISGSTDFAAQWDDIKPVSDMTADTGRIRSFQVIEITDDVNLLSDETSVAADALVAGYTDVVGLSKVVSVDSIDSILILGAGVNLVLEGDAAAMFQFADGGTLEGPEISVMTDAATEGCGHSVYWAVTGKAAGNHTFTLQGQNRFGTANLDTTRRRTLTILELTGVAVSLDQFVPTLSQRNVVNCGPSSVPAIVIRISKVRSSAFSV